MRGWAVDRLMGLRDYGIKIGPIRITLESSRSMTLRDGFEFGLETGRLRCDHYVPPPPERHLHAVE